MYPSLFNKLFGHLRASHMAFLQLCPRNSQIWAKYVQKKVALTKELFGAGRRGSKVLTAQELDDHHGETLTFNFLNSRDSRDACSARGERRLQ